MTRDKTVQFKIKRYIGLSLLLIVGCLMARQIEWQGNKTLHTLMEVVATLLAFMVGVLALIRFYTKRSTAFLFIGAGFIGTAFLDLYHAVVTSALFTLHYPSPPVSLLPWSWVASRLFLSVLMVFSVWASVYEKRYPDRRPVSEWMVYSLMVVATLASFFFFAFYPLPRAYYPEYFLVRPEEFVPAVFFLIALVGYLKKGDWKKDAFEDWVVLSLIVGFMGQVMFMSFSFRLFDTMFDTAHLLKKVSYLFVQQGLFVSMFQLFKQLETSKADLGRALEATQAATRRAIQDKEEMEGSKIELECALEETRSAALQAMKDKQEIEKRKAKLSEVLKQVEITKKEFEAVVESSPNGIVVADRDRKIILVNSMIETMFGYPRSELLGEPVEMLMPTKYREKHEDHMLDYQRRPVKRPMATVPETRDVLGRRKDGTKFPVEIGLGSMETPKGMSVLAVIIDITERRAVEIKLEEQRKNLERANLELDRFVYTASHDLRAPLRGINSFSRFIEEDYADKLDDEGKDYLKRIRKGVRRMTNLIDDLLSLARVSRQKNPYEEVAVKDLVHIATERIEYDIEKYQAKVVIQEEMPVIRCDRIKVTEVFQNLITNAIKFSHKNKDTLPKIEIGYKAIDDLHQFFVKDNGIGIDPKYHEKVFDIFQRLHKREEYEGTGAGLSIVKRVIDDHKGRIWIDSEEGKGTTFHFTIPKNIKAE